MAKQVTKSFRIQFGLRFLFAWTFVFALVCAWFAWQLSVGRRHQEIATRLQAAGCNVYFSHREWVPVANPPAWMAGAGRTPSEERSTLPELMERLGLAPAVRRVSDVTIRTQSDLPAVLELLKELENVDSLTFFNTGITQSQLTDTLDNIRVKKIYLQAAPLPRTRMEWLNHDGLASLCVRGTQFSNPAIEDLPQSLQYLDATRTRISDHGLESFVRLGNLRTLDLCRTPTSETAIDVLRARMPWCVIHWEPLTHP